MRSVVASPLGPLLVVASERGLRRIAFLEPDGASPHADPLPQGEGSVGQSWLLLAEAERQLREYFAGRRRRFDLRLDLAGSDFQRRVWQAIAAVPFGETASYAAIAASAGAANAYRAAGAACAANPVVIVIPCHRVIGSDGGLRGFGGGLATKAWLLRYEGALVGARRELAAV